LGVTNGRTPAVNGKIINLEIREYCAHRNEREIDQVIKGRKDIDKLMVAREMETASTSGSGERFLNAG